MKNWLLIVAVALACGGCSTFRDIAGIPQNPVIQGTVNVASRQQCEQFAKDEPENAKATAQYLSTLHGATGACVDGIAAGLAQ